jgi:hypothetical protein
MSDGRKTLELDDNASIWPALSGDHDVVFAPIGWVTRSTDATSALNRLVEFVRPGGLLVTEEPALPPNGYVAEEPLSVERDRVDLVRLEALDDRYTVKLTTYVTGSVEARHEELVVPGELVIDAVLSRMRWICVGRWADWSGSSAVGSPWHVAVHRAPTGVEHTDS